jgi:hypothetical protein
MLETLNETANLLVLVRLVQTRSFPRTSRRWGTSPGSLGRDAWPDFASGVWPLLQELLVFAIYWGTVECLGAEAARVA